jgi:arginase
MISKNFSKIRIVGVPMDLGAGRRGVDMGPSAIRIAGLSEKLNTMGYSVIDDGDIAVRVPELQTVADPKLRYLPEILRACNLLAARVEGILDEKNFPLILGGDHSISMGTIAGISSLCKKQKKTLGVIWIDAHGDMNTQETSTSGNIHGMPLSASLGFGAIELISIYQSFRKLSPKNTVLIGIRDLDDGEKSIIKKNKMNIFTMENIDKHNIASIIEQALHTLRNVEHLHVSFDVDALDPLIAPGVGTPVRGGLDYREAHYIMEAIAASGRMSSMEIVEVNPILDVRNQSAELAVELALSAFGKRIL